VRRFHFRLTMLDKADGVAVPTRAAFRASQMRFFSYPVFYTLIALPLGFLMKPSIR
jgi:hypothetical protein